MCICSMWELFFFSWVGWDGTPCVPIVLIFAIERECNFQKNENTALLHLKKKMKKPNLPEFTQVLCGLLSLLPTYLYAKIKHIGAKLTVISFSAIFWSQHSMPSIPS